MSTIAERVARGVEWLDENWPLWLRQVDLDSLDIASCRRCILGQTMGDFCDAPDLPFGEMGFASDNEGRDFADLEVEWRRVIAERREAKPDAGS